MQGHKKTAKSKDNERVLRKSGYKYQYLQSTAVHVHKIVNTAIFQRMRDFYGNGQHRRRPFSNGFILTTVSKIILRRKFKKFLKNVRKDIPVTLDSSSYKNLTHNKDSD